MSNNISEIIEIFDRCIKGTATPSERDLFYVWADMPENRDQAIKLWENAFEDSDGSLDMDDIKGEGILEAIWNANRDIITPPADLKSAPNRLSEPSPSAYRVHFLRTAWFRYAAAAAILAFGFAAYFWTTNKKTEHPYVNNSNHLRTDVAPGRDRAILTLGNGKQIMLDSTVKENIIKNGSLTLINQSGNLKYEGTSAVAEYNTLSTPNGGQYRLVLPDGSRVWLNAASSLRFPVSFEGKSREVFLEGEAYFEVAKAAVPFRVNTDNMSVDVIGTHFNIMAYRNENLVKSTLLEGSVKITHNKTALATILTQGMQATINRNAGGLQVSKDVNEEEVVAWKNGYFNFDHADIRSIMRQIARWYDLDIEFRKVTEKKFTGSIARDVKASRIFKMLELTGNVRFIIDGKKVIVN